MLVAMREEGPPPPDIAFAEALDLMDLVAGTDDVSRDDFRDQEVARARAEWAKLRAWAASRVRR